MREEWRDIKGYENQYQVSNKGNVRSLDSIQWRSNGQNYCKFKIYGRVLKPFFTGKKTRNNQGYLTVSLQRKHYKVHRLVAEAFIDNPNNYPIVNHIDGDTTNNSVENLEWCTNLQNVRHAIKNGLTPTGERVTQHKLTEKAVKTIREKYQKGVKGYGAKSLAKEFGVSDATIRAIVNGKKWRATYERG